MEVGVYLPIINLDYKIKNRNGSKEQSIYDVVGTDDKNFSKIINQDLVTRLLNSLDEKNQLVLILYYFEDYTQLEISKLMKMNRRTVSKILRTSLKKMRNEFNRGNGNQYEAI